MAAAGGGVTPTGAAFEPTAVMSMQPHHPHHHPQHQQHHDAFALGGVGGTTTTGNETAAVRATGSSVSGGGGVVGGSIGGVGTAAGSVGGSGGGVGGIQLGLGVGIHGGNTITYAAPMQFATMGFQYAGPPGPHSAAAVAAQNGQQQHGAAEHLNVNVVHAQGIQNVNGDHHASRSGAPLGQMAMHHQMVDAMGYPISHVGMMGGQAGQQVAAVPTQAHHHSGAGGMRMDDTMGMEGLDLNDFIPDLDKPGPGRKNGGKSGLGAQSPNSDGASISGSSSTSALPAASSQVSMSQIAAGSGPISPPTSPDSAGPIGAGSSSTPLHSELLRSGTEHTLETFNQAINACANARPFALIDEAVALLKRVTAQGLEPDQVTFNRMIKAAANARPARVDVAMDMLKRMAWQGLKPDQTTYNSVIQACANAQPAAVDDAMGVLQGMQMQGVDPDLVTFANVITACANALPARVEVAMQMIDQMTTQNIVPDQATYATVIKACANSHPARMDYAMGVLQKMSKQGLEPDQNTFNSVINACVNEHPPRVDDAMSVLNRMSELRLVPDQIAYAGLINACASTQPPRVDNAMSMLKVMQSQGISPNHIIYSAVINACSNAQPARVEEAMELLQQMVAHGIEPNQVVYATVIKACAYSKPAKLNVAAAVLDQMLRYGGSVNGIILSSLLNCCTYANPPQPQQAEQLFRTFIPTGLVLLDDILENALRKAVGAAHTDTLIQWAREAYPMCLQPPIHMGPYDQTGGLIGAPLATMQPSQAHGPIHGAPAASSRFGFAYEGSDSLDYEMGRHSLADEEVIHLGAAGDRVDISERTKKVFAGGLPPNATEISVKESFSVYGNVTEVLLMYDRKMQRFRGFGYITFDSVESVEALCKQRFVVVDGKQVEIKAAQPKAAMDAQRKITGRLTADPRTDPTMKTKKIFCGGLPPSTTEDSIKTVFEAYGAVTEVLLMYDKLIMGDSEVQRFRGFGYITFDSTEPVEMLCRERFLDVDGKQVEIKAALPKAAMDAQKKLAVAAALDAHRQISFTTPAALPPKTKKIFCGGLPPSTTEESIKAVFSEYGEVAEVLLMYDRELQRFRGFGYITFTSEEPVEMLCKAHYIEIGGKQVEIKAAQPKVQMEAQRMLGAQRGRDPSRRGGRSNGERRGRGTGGNGAVTATPIVSSGVPGRAPQDERGPCRAFRSPEGCRYGDRCHFSHK